jgi:FkbM family methyltransferase
VDVGANRGQFALDVIRAAPNAQLTCVEPLPGEADVLERIVGSRPSARVIRTALGARPGIAEMPVLRAADSSSLLSASDLQRSTFPGMEIVDTVTVSVSTLDRLLGDEPMRHPALLKIDVQGYELEVIDGARNRLADFDYVYVELSYVELYMGQPLVTDVMKALFDRGYLLDDAGAPTRRTGRALQQDFLFRRNTEGQRAAR